MLSTNQKRDSELNVQQGEVLGAVELLSDGLSDIE